MACLYLLHRNNLFKKSKITKAVSDKGMTAKSAVLNYQKNSLFDR